ncbi:hypothetical protein D3C87_961540 [compost metagenome]
MKNRLILLVAERDIFELEYRREVGGLRGVVQTPIPFLQPGCTGIKPNRIDMLRMYFRRDGASRIFQSSNVQRLPYACLHQDVRAQQLCGWQVCLGLSIPNHNNAINTPVQHVLETMLNDDDRLPGLQVNPVDQLNGSFAGIGVQACQRFIK